MDWNIAIARNKAALVQVLDEILGLLELALDRRLPRGLYFAAERLLRPAESALRRLLVIAAQQLVVALLPTRPMPEGIAFIRTQTKWPGAFQLFDGRKALSFDADEDESHPLPGTVPHIHSIESFLESRQLAPPATVEISTLLRRFTVLKHALDTLPRQAMRLARWQLRRNALPQAKFRHPLRPGPPPGGNRRPQNEAQRVLRELHALAHHALNFNTS